MITANGCDYAFSHPPIPAMKAAKPPITFACRYLYPFSQEPGTKNLTRPEADRLCAELEHGVVSNFESWANRALDGHDAGVADARMAQAQHIACGGRMDRPIYFSVDFDVQPFQYPAVDAYMLGVASVIGVQRTGVYGSYSTVKHLLDAGLVKWAWQTYAWSGGKYDERCQLSQDKNGVPLGGAEIDLDTAHAADFGQWNYQPDGEPDDMTPEQAKQLTHVESMLQTVILDPAHPYSLQGILSRVDGLEPAVAKLPTTAQLTALLANIGIVLTDEQIAKLAAAIGGLTLPSYAGTFSPVPPAA